LRQQRFGEIVGRIVARRIGERAVADRPAEIATRHQQDEAVPEVKDEIAYRSRDAEKQRRGERAGQHRAVAPARHACGEAD